MPFSLLMQVLSQSQAKLKFIVPFSSPTPKHVAIPSCHMGHIQAFHEPLSLINRTELLLLKKRNKVRKSSQRLQ